MRDTGSSKAGIFTSCSGGIVPSPEKIAFRRVHEPNLAPDLERG
jgi:hypothetical protein